MTIPMTRRMWTWVARDKRLVRAPVRPEIIMTGR
jgi:hypothetical protein